MAVKVTLSELVNKIEKKQITRQDYKRYFEIVPPDKGGGKLDIRLRKSALNTAGTTALATAGVEALAHDAMKGIIESETGDAAATAKVLAEGDSWFDLPWLYSSTIVDALGKNHFPVHEIATPGDTIEDIIGSGEYAKALKSSNYRVFMFSGGGNDVLGDLARHLNQRVSGDNDVANAPRYIKDSFNDTMDHVLNLYKGMVAKVAQISPKTKIFVHGYAYAIAQVNGHWLGDAFAFKGFDPVDDAAMCSAITRAMVDAFNVRLAALAAANKKRVTYMDLRKDVKKNEWWDELHPRPAAARRMADRFAQEMQQYL